MTIDLSTPLADELRRLAGLSGKDVQSLVAEAVRQYLDAAAITDLGADDVSATQASLLSDAQPDPRLVRCTGADGR